MDLRAVQAVRSGDVNAVLVLLVDRGTQLAQRFQMEINRTAADRATSQRRDERLAETMHQRAGEQDRNARRAGQRVDIRHIGELHMRRVDVDDAVGAIHLHIHAMQAQQIGHHMHIANLGHVLQHRFAGGEQRRDHRLAHEVLRATHLDRAVQRFAADHMQDIVLRFRHPQHSYSFAGPPRTSHPLVCHTACGGHVKCAGSRLPCRSERFSIRNMRVPSSAKRT